MPAVREQILAAMKTRFLTIPGIGGRVYRNRDIEMDTFPALNMVGGFHEAEYVPLGVVSYRMAVTVELYVSTATAEAAEIALHALYSHVVKKVRQDETWSGLAIQTDEQGMDEPEPGRAEGQGPTSATSVDLLITFWTLPNDPDVVAP